MVTTIQISEDVKDQLGSFKESSKETYEDVIKKLLDKNSKDALEKDLEEGYLEMAKDTLEMTKEWESIDSELDWEWKTNGV